MHDLYRQSILDSHVQLVDGKLGFHHKAANFVQANPFKCIAPIGVLAVAWIFAGAVICTLLGIMGMKETMDHRYAPRERGDFLLLWDCFCPLILNVASSIATLHDSGQFITESKVEARVQEIQAKIAMLQLVRMFMKQNSVLHNNAKPAFVYTRYLRCRADRFPKTDFRKSEFWFNVVFWPT
jgi:hypothetical protein